MWIQSGQGIDEQPRQFCIPRSSQSSSWTNWSKIRSSAGSSTSVAGRNVALIGGLDAGLSVPVVIRSADTNIVPKISINGGSSGLIENVTVQNGDTLELVVDNSTDVTDILWFLDKVLSLLVLM